MSDCPLAIRSPLYFQEKKWKSRRKETSNGSGTDTYLNFTQTQPNFVFLSPQLLILLCSYPKVQPKACLPKATGFSRGTSWGLSQRCFKSTSTHGHGDEQKKREAVGAPSPASSRAPVMPTPAPDRQRGACDTPHAH